MQTQPTTKPPSSPIPGVIPEPVTVHYDAAPARRRLAVRPTVGGRTRPARHRARSGPTDTLLAGILGVMRNDKRRDQPSPPHEGGSLGPDAGVRSAAPAPDARWAAADVRVRAESASNVGR
jgi:hypothetical protein